MHGFLLVLNTSFPATVNRGEVTSILFFSFTVFKITAELQFRLPGRFIEQTDYIALFNLLKKGVSIESIINRKCYSSFTLSISTSYRSSIDTLRLF